MVLCYAKHDSRTVLGPAASGTRTQAAIIASIAWAVFFIAAVLSSVIAYADSPPIHVNLVFEKATYSLALLPGTSPPEPEPIKFAVTLENTGLQTIFAQDDFSASPLELLVTFVGPDGKGITAPKLSELELEGPPPRILLVGDAYVQVDSVESLAPGDIASVVVPDAHSFYPLNQCGRYTAKVTVPIRTYPVVSRTFGGIDYADLDSANFAGVVESSPVNFLLTADADNDGSTCPDDCDDANPAVHPGLAEVRGNGIDDDCNPATLDVVPMPPAQVLLKAKKKRTLVDGVVVRLFDNRKGACFSQFKGKKKVKSIWLSCTSLFDGVTGGAKPGELALAVPPGSYLMIAEYDPDATSMNGNEVLIAASLGKLKSGKLKKGTIGIKEKRPPRTAISEEEEDEIAPDLSEEEE